VLFLEDVKSLFGIRKLIIVNCHELPKIIGKIKEILPGKVGQINNRGYQPVEQHLFCLEENFFFSLLSFSFFVTTLNDFLL